MKETLPNPLIIIITSLNNLFFKDEPLLSSAYYVTVVFTYLI